MNNPLDDRELRVMKRNMWLSACEGKERLTLAQANSIINRRRHSKGRWKAKPYLCKNCNTYHIGANLASYR